MAAIAVPDETTWTMAGRDPAGVGLTPTASGLTARALLAPARVPEPLADAVRSELRRASVPLTVRMEDAVALRGRPLAAILGDPDGVPAAPEGPRDDDDGGGHDDGGHGHGDMMAIVGEPSADGLVMEAIDFRFGPLTAVLPGGLVVDVSLDGDVVAACEVGATLRAGDDGPPAGVDPLAPVAWAVADRVARESREGTVPAATTQWRRLAAVELERALSHLAWLRSVGRTLGWAQLTDAAQRAVTAVGPMHGLEVSTPAPAPAAVRAVLAAVAPATGLVAGHRFAYRTRGRARTVDRALVGPNARATGASADARAGDPLYSELGFVPVLEDGADALARAQVRAREIEQSVSLAAAALERTPVSGAGVPEAFATPAGARVEGPRGPLLAAWLPEEQRTVHAVRGARAMLALAGRAVVGLEWSAALAALVSFDLSPWVVGR